MTYDRPFLCLRRACVAPNGERTVLGEILRNGDLKITGPAITAHKVGVGQWNVVCRCGMTRAFRTHPDAKLYWLAGSALEWAIDVYTGSR